MMRVIVPIAACRVSLSRPLGPVETEARPPVEVVGMGEVPRHEHAH